MFPMVGVEPRTFDVWGQQFIYCAQWLLLNRIVELIMFITFANEILPVDGVWNW